MTDHLSSAGTYPHHKHVPLWVWGIIVFLAILTPACHFWMSQFPPPGTAFTGMRCIDDGTFRHCLRMFSTGFHSPYALPMSPHGAYSHRYFLHHPMSWILGIAGPLGTFLHIDEFLYLGICNGFGALLYLLAVYFLMRELAPRQANIAFLLHTLGGGLAGLLFLLTRVAGWHDSPGFQTYFYRFARHELLEGAHLNAVTLFPRLYYTLSLACLFASIVLLSRFLRANGKGRLVTAGLLALLGTFINLRYGVPLLAVVILWQFCATSYPVRLRAAVTSCMALAVLLGTLAAMAMISSVPSVMANQTNEQRFGVWVSSLLGAGILYFAAAAAPCWRASCRLPLLPRVMAAGMFAWGAAFAGLYLAYNAYYGSLLTPADFTAAVWASDKALVAIPLGLLLGWRFHRKPAEQEPTDWIVLWFLAMLIGSVGAFLAGSYLRLTPARLLILAGVPLSILAAQGLQSLRIRKPFLSNVFLFLLLVCGVLSQAVSLLYYQGPLGWQPNRGPHPYWQYMTMSQADDQCLDALAGGTVLTPFSTAPAVGDLISLRNTANTVFGVGSMALSGLTWAPVVTDVNNFFSPGATDALRKEIAEKYALDYVFCPDTTPLPPETLASLENTQWLTPVKQCNNARLFRVAR